MQKLVLTLLIAFLKKKQESDHSGYKYSRISVFPTSYSFNKNEAKQNQKGTTVILSPPLLFPGLDDVIIST